MQHRPTGVKLLLVLLGVVLAAGCGDDGDLATGDAPAGPALAAEHLSIEADRLTLVAPDGRGVTYRATE